MDYLTEIIFGQNMQVFWMAALVLLFILFLHDQAASERAAPTQQRAEWTPTPARPMNLRGLRTAGAVVVAVGLALTLALLTLGIGPWLIAGFVPFGVGLPLLTISNRKLLAGGIVAGAGMGMSAGLLTLGIGPWLIGGLAPLFVGLALLLVGVVDSWHDSDSAARI